MPALVAEGILVFKIASLIAFDLRDPEINVGFLKPEVLTVFMSVPKATVDEDDGAVFRQDEIGLAGQGFVFRAVHREAVAEAVEHRAQGELRLCVLSSDAGHDLGALFRSEYVHGGRLKT